MAIFLAPYLIYSEIHYGDPMYSANIRAVWWRNFEFVRIKEVGCPGCPLRQELSTNSYAGSYTTNFQYIFRMHSLQEVIKNTVSGYMDLFLEHTSLFKLQIGKSSAVFYWLFLLGVVTLLISQYREVLLFPLLTINLLAFLIPLRIDPRLVAHVAPFTALVVGFSIWRASLALYRILPGVRQFLTRFWGS